MVVVYLAWAMGQMFGVADWGGGMSAGCTAGPIVCQRGQWMAAQCAAVSLAHASQSATTSDIVKRCCS